MPLFGDGCLPLTAKEMSFFIFSVVIMVVELTFGRSENLKKVICNHPVFSFWKSNVYCARTNHASLEVPSCS